MDPMRNSTTVTITTAVKGVLSLFFGDGSVAFGRNGAGLLLLGRRGSSKLRQ